MFTEIVVSRTALIFFLLAWLSGSVAVRAQNGMAMSRQVWLSTYWYWQINDHFVYNQDVGAQQGLGDEGFSRMFIRSQLNRRLSTLWSLHGGLIFIGTRDALDSNRVEIRPWAGIKANWPRLWKILFSHYVRMEYRLLYECLPGYWDPGTRFRYRLGAVVPINRASLSKGAFFAGVSYEVLSNYVRDMASEGRMDDFHKFDIGIGYVLSKSVRLELLFVNLDAYENTRERYVFTDQIYQLKFRKYFNFD